LNETIPGSGGQEMEAGEQRRLDELLARAREIVRDVLAPRALATDQSDDVPADNVRQLAEAGLLGLSTPRMYGGHGAPGSVLRAHTEILAAACGTTTFVQGQHLSACALIAGGDNEALKQSVLPLFASGQRICGVAFSHLRRPGPPVLRAEPDGDGFVFDGSAPWFTGWGVMTDVVLGGTLPDGRFVYAVAPLAGSSVEATPPMRLCAMNASGTVILTIRGLRVPANSVMKTITREQMAANDLGAILGVTPQIFGVSRASMDLLRSLSEMRKSETMRQTLDALEAEMAWLRHEVDCWRDQTATDGYKENALRIRSHCIEFGVRAAHAAVAATGGGANSRDNHAQRLFREAMFYTLTAQTRDVQTATLEHLAESSRRSMT
jgi:alkylation response protein AidB-like acyl-CoA dehydrogenase